VFCTHVNGQNLLTAELKYLFLLRNKALLLTLSTGGFVPQAGEKSLRGRNGQAGKMPLERVVCLHSRKFARVQRGSTSPPRASPLRRKAYARRADLGIDLISRRAAEAACVRTPSVYAVLSKAPSGRRSAFNSVPERILVFVH